MSFAVDYGSERGRAPQKNIIQNEWNSMEIVLVKIQIFHTFFMLTLPTRSCLVIVVRWNVKVKKRISWKFWEDFQSSPRPISGYLFSRPRMGSWDSTTVVDGFRATDNKAWECEKFINSQTTQLLSFSALLSSDHVQIYEKEQKKCTMKIIQNLQISCFWLDIILSTTFKKNV